MRPTRARSPHREANCSARCGIGPCPLLVPHSLWAWQVDNKPGIARPTFDKKPAGNYRHPGRPRKREESRGCHFGRRPGHSGRGKGPWHFGDVIRLARRKPICSSELWRAESLTRGGPVGPVTLRFLAMLLRGGSLSLVGGSRPVGPPAAWRTAFRPGQAVRKSHCGLEGDLMTQEAHFMLARRRRSTADQ
jgi:hypothetical protein